MVRYRLITFLSTKAHAISFKLGSVSSPSTLTCSRVSPICIWKEKFLLIKSGSDILASDTVNFTPWDWSCVISFPGFRRQSHRVIRKLGNNNCTRFRFKIKYSMTMFYCKATLITVITLQKLWVHKFRVLIHKLDVYIYYQANRKETWK